MEYRFLIQTADEYYFEYFQSRGEMQCVAEIDGKYYYQLYFSTPAALAHDSLIGEANIIVIPELTKEQVHKAMKYLLFDGMRDYFTRIKKFSATKARKYVPANF
jgi:hypothetical protein